MRKPSEEQERRRLIEKEDLKAVLSNASGKRFIVRLLDSLGFMSDPYNKNNQLQSMAIGRLQVANNLVTDIALIDIELYFGIIKEYQRSTIEHMQAREQEVKASKS